MKRYKMMVIYAVMTAIILCGCSSSKDKGDKEELMGRSNSVQKETSTISTSAEFDIDQSINEDYIDESYDENATKVELTETYTITSSGTYILAGEIKDGQIIVNNKQSGKVKLVFDGVKINCSNGPAVNVVQGKTIITLAKDSENTVTDGGSYDNDEESACIYSKDDLCINGKGNLLVTSNYKTGIQSKDDLRIINGNITVNAEGDGIKGKDSVVIKGGKIDVTAGKDGVQATNTEEGKGYILVLGGEVNISCASDGVKAETIVEINDGNINIEKSEEGIESIYIRLNGGDIKICSTDDGINASDGSGMDAGGKFAGGRGGGFRNESQPDNQESLTTVIPIVYINGGKLYVNAGGDGLDSNGAIYINGGNINVDGPTNNGNGFFDYATAFEIKGGELIGCGSSGMLEVPGSDSTQNTIVITGISGEEGSVFVIKDSSGNEIVSYQPSKSYQALVYSSVKIKKDETYTAYNNDVEIGQVKVEDVISYIGEIRGGMPGGFGGGNQSPPQMPEGFDGERPERPEGFESKDEDSV